MKNLYLVILLLTLGMSPTFAQYFGGSGDGAAVAAYGGSGSEVLLPIKLVYFNAITSNGKVNTNWSTASQTNNNYFTVERAVDGVNFKALGTITGVANSNERLSYAFTDEEPLMGNAYYRLKQTDFDGKFEYSGIVAVLNAINKPDVQLYPNPANGAVIITGMEQADLIIVNSVGNKVVVQQLSALNATIDTSNMLNGIYYVYISLGKESVVKKLVIQH
jgi:hypothetical protein